MPVPIALQGWYGGIDSIPYVDQLFAVAKVLPWLALLYVLKWYFQGAWNKSERNMHGKVVIITGGTSGIGAQIAKELANRGAQLVLLTQHPLSDPFLVEYIEDLRDSTKNELITAEQVDLLSLHSIRLFATKWVDNAPPRRLDMVVLCANSMSPAGARVQPSEDGVESDFAINYLANFQLLSILSPAIRAQPPDRDVRIIFGTCASYMGGRVPETVPRPSLKSTKALKTTTPSAVYAASKLALMTFASAFQKHLSAYKRPDQQPMNAHVIMVDPGWTRTPGMRRFITRGSLWGLLLYLLTWPLWWLVLKSADAGAQSFLYAAMDPDFERGEGGMLVKECRELKVYRNEVSDTAVQKALWETTQKAIEALEKEGAVRRQIEKKQADASPRPAETSAMSNGAASSERKAGSRRSRKAA